MDPIAQIFAQIGAATAKGEGMGQYFMQGRQLALQEEGLDIQREGLELQRKSLDLRERSELTDAMLKRFQHEQVVKKLDEQVSNEAALSALDQLVGGAIAKGQAADPSAWAGITDILSTNPKLRFDARTKEILDDYQFAARQQQARLQFTEALKSGGRTPADVREVEQARAWDNQAEAIQDFDPEGAAKLRADAAALRRREPVAPAPLQQASRVSILTEKQVAGTITSGEAAELRNLTVPSNRITNEDLVTGAPIVEEHRGRYERPPDYKDRVIGLRKNTDALGLIEDLEVSSATDHVGAVPRIKKTIFDQILPQLGFDTSSPDRAVAQSALTRFTQQGIRALNAEARLSNQDATMLMQAFPNIDSWLESPARAEAMLKAFKRATAIGAVRDAKAATMGVPPIAGKTLTVDDLKRLVQLGDLTPDEAKALGKRYGQIR